MEIFSQKSQITGENTFLKCLCSMMRIPFVTLCKMQWYFSLKAFCDAICIHFNQNPQVFQQHIKYTKCVGNV